MRNCKISSLLAVLALLSACGSGRDPRLAPLANAVLEPGRGLGDVRVGETTLGEFVDRFGSGRTDCVASDHVGLELVFEHGELSFLFLYEENPRSDEECQALRRATRDLPAFLAGDPHRRELRLASLSVRAGDELDSTFYRGRLAPGIALLDPLLESIARIGIPEDSRPPMVAGMSPDLPSEKACYPARGLVLYGEREPRQDRPSRVTRITLFAPENP